MLKSLGLLFVLLVLLWFAQASAQDSNAGLEELWSDVTEEDSSNSTWLLIDGFSGYTELAPRVYLKDRNSFANDEQLLSTTEIEIDATFTSNITGYLRPRLFFDLADSKFQRLELFEMYITYVQENWDLRVGQFVENWGITDTFNPVDVLNRRDLSTQLLDTTRLGEAGVRARWLFKGNDLLGEPTLSFYFLPWFQRARFAPDKQRLGLGSEAVSFEEKQEFEPDSNEAYFYALRYQSTLNTTLFNADIQLIASKGADKYPLIRPLNSATSAPIYYGKRIIGAGVRAVPNSSNLARFTFKLEVVQNNPYAFDNTPTAIPNAYRAQVIGFDWDSYNMLKKQDQLTLTLEYANESGVSRAESDTFSRAFSDDLIMRLYWQAGDFDRTSIELRGIYDLDNNEHVAEVTYATSLLKLHEDLKIELSAIYVKPSSDPSATYSQLPDYTSAAMALRFDF